MEKIYYRPRELIELGYPRKLVMQTARKIGRKSSQEAEKGFHYLLTIKEVERELCLRRT